MEEIDDYWFVRVNQKTLCKRQSYRIVSVGLGKEYTEVHMYNSGVIYCVVLERDDHAYYIHILLALYRHKSFKP